MNVLSIEAHLSAYLILNNGQMSAAFTNDKVEFRAAIIRFQARVMHLKVPEGGWSEKKVEEALLGEREGERQREHEGRPLADLRSNSDVAV